LFGLIVGKEKKKDLVIAWDVNDNDRIDGPDFFSTILADFNEKTLKPSNFLFDSDLLA
jgi:hypothetical protein